MVHVSAILLAAGTSSRMGNENKLLLKIGQKTVIHKACENLLASELDSVIVILGDSADLVQKEVANLDVECVLNEEFNKGMSSSLKAGIRAIKPNSDGAFVLLADQPFIKPETINRFIISFKENTKPIIAARFGEIIGSPVLFHRKYFPELLEIAGDVGARSIVHRYRDDVFPIEINEDETIDIDTPERFKAMSKRFGDLL